MSGENGERLSYKNHQVIIKGKTILLEKCKVSYQRYSAVLTYPKVRKAHDIKRIQRQVSSRDLWAERQEGSCCASRVSSSLSAIPQLTGDSYLNQCNQRWNDNGDAHCQNCRKLVAQGFPCPCGHAHKDILLSCKNNRRKLKASAWCWVPQAQAGGVGSDSTCVHVPGGTARKTLQFRF